MRLAILRRVPCALLLCALALRASPGRAQAPSSNEAAAEALFNEGRALVASGRVEEGCKKLEASQALDPGTGTLIHLADCHEKAGRTATAWARCRETAARAARDGRPELETVAKTRAGELEPKLARLRVDAPAGVVVRRGDVEIPSAALGSALPIDPGEYTITASAPGKRPWSTRARVAPAESSSVVVPALEPESTASEPPTGHAADASEPGSARRVLGFTLGGLGVAGLGAGAVAGLMAIGANDRSKEVCPADGVCADERARRDNADARTAATVSTIGFAAGGVLLATGVALVLSAPSGPTRTTLRASPHALLLEGTW